MLGRFFSARMFSLTAGVGYAAAVYINLPLFRYYPLVGRFSLTDLQDPTLGPAMSWFGWMASGLIFAVVATALVPKRLGDRIPASVFWIVLLLMSIAAGYREREWFVSVAQ